MTDHKISIIIYQAEQHMLEIHREFEKVSKQHLQDLDLS